MLAKDIIIQPTGPLLLTLSIAQGKKDVLACSLSTSCGEQRARSSVQHRMAAPANVYPLV